MNPIRETSHEESESSDSEDSDLIIIKASSMSKSRSKHSTTDTIHNSLDNTFSSTSSDDDEDYDDDDDDDEEDDDDDDYDDSDYDEEDEDDESGNHKSSIEENTLIRIKDRATECKEGRTVKKSYMWRVVPDMLDAEREPLEVETPHQFSITVESILPVMTFKVALPKPTEEITFEQQGPSTIILKSGSKGAAGSFVFNVTMHYLAQVETHIAITSYCKLLLSFIIQSNSKYYSNYPKSIRILFYFYFISF